MASAAGPVAGATARAQSGAHRCWPQQYLHVYETFERALHPRVVLVGLSLANDFEDAELFDRWWRTDGRENYQGSGRPSNS